jgi:Acetoacetate decarboxylase (ADC)
MGVPKRLKEQEGRFALVDGIPFALPINCEQSPVLFAVFPINADKAQKLMPGNEMHAFRIWGDKGLLVITVVDYRVTDIGKYIEFSIAIACTNGPKQAPALLPALFMKSYGVGQFVLDLPVSTEISVKGGKGVWGMPKHQANLNYIVGKETVSSQYDLDGQLAMKIEIDIPKKLSVPINTGAANYCSFRGMLMKSYIYFKGKLWISLFKKGSARLTLGDHPRLAMLKDLEIEPNPILTAFMHEARGVLDDYYESWFLTFDRPPETMTGEGMESVIDLGLGQEWLAPPSAVAGGRNGSSTITKEA